MKKAILFKIVTIFTSLIVLSGCISKHTDSLGVATNRPLVNIAENIASQLDVDAEVEYLAIKNSSTKEVNLAYKLFWYSQRGTTQVGTDEWHNLALKPSQKQQIELNKPTQQSYYYRIYIRKN
ncbi:DUF1425 domain-containing protein [Pasteurella atlantica]|uniref:DUF1425 domain-containing protein n=1 Tax=Pasteurellaceae TaxID=712 RepID=UPI0027652811|nr:DUF1425 domain-containing protein [Pasteurella atlantica]MDP8032741.1 DUF1425 domain-containing protein [Pasteurella atlantica]MDP8034753.1 DUF1425 domain-containing protein [Pasteurella atlantica]MDP8036703.1 DUF1425 domain-containing protein [Pasteurella atlantica]MDP8046975.1 DUF1425 domain-containing protein [Pasteurella atlantica]MDP8048928.1 DUF1425 domain-containing protein [Pasteurella atlantica]